MNGLCEFLIGLSLNLATSLIIVRWIYYPKHRSRKYVFTFLAFNLIIYLVVSMMTSVEMSIGVGFGLFAIFSVLRYRTNPIPIREMTYLFIIAALPVMNGSAAIAEYWATLLIANLTVIMTLFILENGWGFSFESSKTITYEKINLIKPENRAQLVEDLEERTGLIIKRLEIGKINFLRDTANIHVYYDNGKEVNWQQIPEGNEGAKTKQDSTFTN